MIFNKLELVAKISINSVLINIVISAALFKSLMEYLFRLQQQNEVVILSTIKWNTRTSEYFILYGYFVFFIFLPTDPFGISKTDKKIAGVRYKHKCTIL